MCFWSCEYLDFQDFFWLLRSIHPVFQAGVNSPRKFRLVAGNITTPDLSGNDLKDVCRVVLTGRLCKRNAQFRVHV